MRSALFAACLAGVAATCSVVSAEEIHVPAERGTGAVLRALDMITQRTTDLEIENGQSVRYKSLIVTVKECRYPSENPDSDAFAYVVIRENGKELDRFAGWMIASSPALSAMDHQRYDIWVLRCKRPAAETSDSG